LRPSLHTFLRFAATGLALFALIYGLNLAVTGEVFPPWNDVSIFFTCVTLSLLFTFYRPALRQLPLLFFALSAISSPLHGISTAASPSQSPHGASSHFFHRLRALREREPAMSSSPAFS